MHQVPEITDWLRDADLTTSQRAEFAQLVRAYDALHPERQGSAADWADEDTAAWVAALEQVQGHLDVARRGRAYRDAREAAYAGAVVAVLGGMSEVQAAEQAGIARMTLRKALGK